MDETYIKVKGQWRYLYRAVDKEGNTIVKMLKELDDIFLSMEGLGQYVGVAWLIHPKGGNLPIEVAVKGFRRNGRWWSQDEGLALFLILNRLTNPNWKDDMFGKEPKYIVALLKQTIL
ncbi:DDE-type integrase/transposase/recombinase [Crocinitomix catalasitica]|nr:DDE-type integrase/transposase/recombinase [Crocinitomix catalasitica]